MITHSSAPFQGSSVDRRLPWLIGGAAVLFYAITLSHWITPDSAETIQALSAWDTQAKMLRPFAMTLLFPLRVLPETWIPSAANLFTAVIAAGVLMTLARSVSLLRYDVMPEGDIRKSAQVGLLTLPTAWMPPTITALICGLQLGFWGNATAATAQMPTVLLFAFALRSLLEFRITRHETWLTRASVAFGAGMADNWAMLAYLPVFIAALIGMKTFSGFLSPRFLMRMILAGAIGIVCCLLIPVLSHLMNSSGDATVTLLQEHLRTQKQMLGLFKLPPMRLLALTGLIPLLILAVRWKSHTIQNADDTPQGVFVAKATGHFIHAAFFIVAIWIALEPGLAMKGMRLGEGWLIHQSIWAVAAGYCAGYLLLFKQGTVQIRPSKFAANSVGILMVALAAILFLKNVRSLSITNGGDMRAYIRSLADSLPAGDCALLTDESWMVIFLKSELAARHRSGEVMVVEAPRLISPEHHRSRSAVFGKRWPVITETNQSGQIKPVGLVAFVRDIVERERVFYAHPSSGLFFEDFVAASEGTLHRLSHRTTRSETASLAVTEAVWQRRWDESLRRFAERVSGLHRSEKWWRQPGLKWLRVSREENPTVALLSTAHSKALNVWGVRCLQSGRTQDALVWFDRSIALYPRNLSALINREFASRRARGDSARLTIPWVNEQFPEAFGAYENWWDVISRNGPVDEPTFLLQTGRFFMATRNPRQAIESFSRAQTLSPDWLMPKIAEAQTRNMVGEHERALALLDGLSGKDSHLRAPGLAQLLLCRAVALRGLGRLDEMWELIESNVSRYPAAPEMISAAAVLCGEGKRFDRELELLIRLQPLIKSDGDFFQRRGLAEFRLGRHEQAEESLTRALDLEPGDVSARSLRALNRLASGKPDRARTDYEALLKTVDGMQPALLGLGNLAFRDQDTNAAILFYERFVSNAPAMSPQSSAVRQRLKLLKEEF